LPSRRLREFSADEDDIATLVCAPLALHDATLTDFAPGHSLVAALQMAGLRNLFVTDWRSASPDMRFFSIDSYLADLNVAMDELGARSPHHRMPRRFRTIKVCPKDFAPTWRHSAASTA